MAIQDEIPKSRLTLTYRTTISGEMQEVTLPFRYLVLADFSLGSSRDRKLDLADRELRPLSGRNLDGIMKDMKMSLRTTVKNCIDPKESEQIDIDIPIDSMSSFSPDRIAQNVPKIRALLLVKQLLLEMQGTVDNRKDIRKLIQDLYSKPELVQGLREQLAAFSGLQIPAEGSSAG